MQRLEVSDAVRPLQWLLGVKGLNLIQIDQYKLVRHFSRKMCDRGGSSIYWKKGIRTKKLNCFKRIGAEKECEISVIELVDYGYSIVCIYRSPDSKFFTSFKTLELTIQIAQAER